MTQDTKVASSEPAQNAFGRVLDLTIQLATSRVGQITAYFAAVTAAIVAFQKVAEPLKDTPPWMRAALIFSLPLLVLIFQVIPAVLEQRRKKRLTEITGNLQSGYFSLKPREDKASFKRADGEHQDILQWLE